MQDRYIFILVVSILFILLAGCTGSKKNSEQGSIEEFQKLREQMIETQIKQRGVKDPHVITAMLKVERHRFVTKEFQPWAYADRPLPIGEEQTISQPYIVALMTELLELKGDEKVLEVGTGSGYQAAILAELVKEVYTIEIIESLAASAKNLLLELGYRNVRVIAGDGYLGWPEEAPFDAIIVTAAPDHVPVPLIEQLKEGGLLVIPVGTHHQKLMKMVKKSGRMESTEVIPVIFVPMTGEGVKQKK